MKALDDAEVSLGMHPGWVKGLFRKGKALAGLKVSRRWRRKYDGAALCSVLEGDSFPFSRGTKKPSELSGRLWKQMVPAQTPPTS